MTWETLFNIKHVSGIKVFFFFNFCVNIYIYNVIFFSSLFHRGNIQRDLYFRVYGKEDTIFILDLNWYFTVYSGKVESSSPLYEGLRCLQ